MKAISDVEANRARLKRYLVIRGVFSVRSIEVLLGFAASIRQAQDDLAACLQYGQQNGPEKSKTFSQCNQIRRCGDLSAIPL
jgi:hypothetical protein